MTKILGVVLFSAACFAALYKGCFFIPPVPFEILVVLVVLVGLLVALCVAVPLARIRRVRGIGLASLLRRCCRFAMLLTLALGCFATPRAEAQLGRRAWTNLPAGFITTLARSNFNNNPFALQRSKGVGVWLRYTNEGIASCTNLVVDFEVSPDSLPFGTNWTTLNPAFRCTSLATNGIALNLYWTNLVAGDMARLNNVMQIRPSFCSNYGTGRVWLAEAAWTFTLD